MRRTHGAAFNAKVAFAAFRGDKTLAAQFGVHPAQMTKWKQHLLARAFDVFGGTKSMSNTPDDVSPENDGRSELE